MRLFEPLSFGGFDKSPTIRHGFGQSIFDPPGTMLVKLTAISFSAIALVTNVCAQEAPLANTDVDNNNPVAVDDVYGVAQGQTLTVAAAGVLANDSDPDGDTLNAVVEKKPSFGKVELKADGSFTYEHNGTLDSLRTGERVVRDQFTYTISDGKGGSDTGTVFIADPLERACFAQTTRLGVPGGDQPALLGRICKTLASYITIQFQRLEYQGAPTREKAPEPSARDLQARTTATAGDAGSPTQAEAVSTVEPVALAGGSLAAVGSDGGSDAIVAFSVNPASLFGSSAPAKASGKSRSWDLTLLFPAGNVSNDNEEEAGKDDRAIDYFGARLRVNITGLSKGDAVYKDAVEKFQAILNQRADIHGSIVKALTEAADMAQCTDVMLRVASGAISRAAIEGACGGVILDLDTIDKQEDAFRKALREALFKADQYYWGLDLRTDFGDPTLGAVDSSAGTFFYAGLAAGKRFGNVDTRSVDDTYFGLRGHVGVRFANLEDIKDDSHFSVDGAVGVEIKRPLESQDLQFAAGLNFRFGVSESENLKALSNLDQRLQTDYLLLRLSLDVPITASNSISVSYSTPLGIGDIGPALSLNANWKLLLPD